jgi:multiple sugar transport system permease protein
MQEFNEQKFIKRISSIIFYTIVIFFVIIALFPFVWGIITSLKPTSEMNNFSIPLSRLTFDAYRYILGNFPFGKWIFNSFAIALSVTLGNVLVNSLAGYALARINFTGKNCVFWVVLALMMIPGQVTMVPMFIILVKLGWVNTYQGLIIPFMFSFFNIFLMRQFFLSIPKSLEEAAEIDGLGRFGTFFRIILPISGPALATQFILTYIGNWNSFLWPSLLARSDSMYTLPVGLNSFQLQYVQFWNQILAGAMLLTIPIIIVFIILQKYFIEGISGTGIKD